MVVLGGIDGLHYRDVTFLSVRDATFIIHLRQFCKNNKQVLTIESLLVSLIGRMLGLNVGSSLFFWPDVIGENV